MTVFAAPPPAPVWADWFYSENVFLHGVWYGHSKHFYTDAGGATYQFQDTYDNYNFGDPPPDPGDGDCPEQDPEAPHQEECEEGTPILLPLTNSQAFHLTTAAEGVLFDLNADGTPERTSWTAADSKLAFLAIDRDGDGFITSGKELFGNHTVPGASNGFAALRTIMPLANDQKTGGGGYIDVGDPLYAKLMLWEDVNHNGVSEPNELQPLSNLYTRIGLGYSTHKRKDGFGNEFRYRGFAEYRTASGKNVPMTSEEQQLRQRTIYDVVFTQK